MKRQGCWVWLFPVFAVGFILFAAGGAGFQYINSQPWFCNSCHEMNFYYRTWQTSQHASSAKCLDCHAEPGVAGFIEEKVRGAEQVIAHFRGNYPLPIRILIRVKNAQCIACHPNPAAIRDQSRTANHAVHLQKQVLCADCHSRIIHADAAKNQPKVVALDKCESCHKRHADFPLLVGKHATADCAQCHPGGKYGGTSSQCESCHKPPAANHPGGNTNCQVCHSPEGWTPAKVDHNQTKLPLTGKHQQVACQKCHGDPFTKPASALCESCHKPPAANHPGGNTNCQACHSPEGWKPATVDHNQTRFPLVGQHQQVACQKCHGDPFTKPTSTLCEACHKPPPANHPGGNTNCQACHSPDGWKPAKVDHSKTNFPLVGQHQQVACVKCHGDPFTRPASTSCAACHKPPASHAGMTATCDTCHTPQGFKPANFTHSQVGEHIPFGERPLTCDRCHRTGVFMQHDCTGSGCHSSNNPREG